MIGGHGPDYPPEILELFQRYRHSRRAFMERAAKLALSALAAAATFESLSSRPVSAQTSSDLNPRPVKRVAVIGAGHYHATAAPGYLNILKNLHLEIVGVHDFDPAMARSRAEFAGSTPYTDYKQMCEQTKPDFVLSLCRHDMMSDPVRYLINAGLPFMAEKPWGIDPKVVNELANLADQKKAWATFPASMRYTAWAQTCREMYQKQQLGDISHMLVRFNNPGTQRYIDEGSAWMLSKKTAGGGALLNLGIHGFDLCTYITGEIPKVVAASTSHNICNLEIEDYALVTLRTPSGMIFVNEASYTYPINGTDSEHTISAKNFLVREAGNAAHVTGPGRNESVTMPPGYVGSWPGAVADAIDRLGKGLPPAATAQDNARAVQLTFDAYRMAGEKS
jgi:predicted dehydrogenase